MKLFCIISKDLTFSIIQELILVPMMKNYSEPQRCLHAIFAGILNQLTNRYIYILFDLNNIQNK